MRSFSQSSAPLGIAILFAMIFCLLTAGCGGGTSALSSSSSSSSGSSTVVTGSHILGSQSAKVQIVEFSDFQCPYCKAFYTDTESQIVQTYVNTGKVLFAYRHRPLTSIHQNPQNAAEAAECAARIGGNDAFWKYHDTLFTFGQSDGSGLNVADLKQYAANLNLDTASFNQCLDTHATASIVNQDSDYAVSMGATGTPSFLINGQLIVGAKPFSTFQATIDAALQ